MIQLYENGKLIFEKNRKAYGTRKIKSKTPSIAQYKPSKTTCNESQQKNELNRQFEQSEEKRVVVSDLTYVKVQNRWYYICVFVDLFNREINWFKC